MSHCVASRVLAAGVLAAGCLAVGSASAKPWKPHKINIKPGVPLKPDDIKPYHPPNLPPEPSPEPSDVKAVEITVEEAAISMRPWGSPLLGNAIQGARLPIKGVVTPKKGSGCKVWYALDPWGYVCNREAKPTTQPLTTDAVLKVADGERLPFHYVMVLVKEGDKVPSWASVDDLKKGVEPDRQLEHGDTIAVEKPLKWEGENYWVAVDGRVLAAKGSSQMGGGSEWHGLELTDATPLPFGWITPDKAKGFDAPPEAAAKAVPAGELLRRSRVAILEEQKIKNKRWLKVKLLDPPPVSATAKTATATATASPGPSPSPTLSELWVSADAVNEARLLERPPTVGAEVTQWIDVDLGEQVLVAYENDKPVFATLVSSGRAIPTPMGTYPVWAKAYAITMKNQPYEDKEYFVHKVPWSTFFQWHNAIHGAYWHDRFGVVKSHGCVNVSPLDARHVFEWVHPVLPPGWSGYRPAELLKSPTVVVRDSHKAKQFRQDRPIGPPDRELEGQRAEEAEARRAQEAEAAAAQAAATPSPAPSAAPSQP